MPYKQFPEFEQSHMIGKCMGDISFREITPSNVRTVMRVLKRWTSENKPKPRQWGTQYAVTTRWQIPHSYGSHRTYGVLPCISTTLEHGYMCIIVCVRGSSTSATPRAACKNSFEQDPLTLIHWPSGYNWPTASGMFIDNKSSSQVSLSTIRTITMDLYVKRCRGERHLPEYRTQRHTIRTSSVMVCGSYWISRTISLTTHSRNAKISALHRGI